MEKMLIESYNYKKEKSIEYKVAIFPFDEYDKIKLYNKILFVEKELAESLQFAFDEIKILASLLDYEVTWSKDIEHYLKDKLKITNFCYSPNGIGPVHFFLEYVYTTNNVLKSISSRRIDYSKDPGNGRVSDCVYSDSVGNDLFSATNSLRELL